MGMHPRGERVGRFLTQAGGFAAESPRVAWAGFRHMMLLSPPCVSRSPIGRVLLRLAPLLLPTLLRAQPAAPRDTIHGAHLPFPVGEVLEYRVNVRLGGDIGHGQMRVEGPVLERGIPTWRLVSEMSAKRAFVKATDRTTSWIDPEDPTVTVHGSLVPGAEASLDVLDRSIARLMPAHVPHRIVWTVSSGDGTGP